jgi:hypothetical protein
MIRFGNDILLLAQEFFLFFFFSCCQSIINVKSIPGGSRLQTYSAGMLFDGMVQCHLMSLDGIVWDRMGCRKRILGVQMKYVWYRKEVGFAPGK